MITKVRESQKKDLKKISHFYEFVDKDFVPPLTDRFSIYSHVKNILKSKNCGHILFFEDNFLKGVLEYKIKSENIAYIAYLAIHPKHRFHGIGTTLVKIAIKKFKEMGMKKILISTWSTNKIALHIYNKKLGFKIIKRIKDERGPGIDGLLLEKLL